MLERRTKSPNALEQKKCAINKADTQLMNCRKCGCDDGTQECKSSLETGACWLDLQGTHMSITTHALSSLDTVEMRSGELQPSREWQKQRYPHAVYTALACLQVLEALIERDAIPKRE